MTTCGLLARSGKNLWFLGGNNIGAGFSDGGGGYARRRGGGVGSKTSTSVLMASVLIGS